jgi:hypothetical protein
LNHFQGHVIKLSLHGQHLSNNLRTFLARLIVPFSSSELDVRDTAHIQRCGQTPRRYGVSSRCCSLPTMDRPLPLVPGVAPTPSWAIKVFGEMISSYRKPQRRLTLTKWDVTSHYSRWRANCQISSCHGHAGGAPAAGVGGGVPAERIPRVTPPNLARRGEVVNGTKKD